MDELQGAISTAKEFVQTHIPEADAPQLEEVERDGDAWIITLSFARMFLEDPSPLHRYNVYENRVYKQLRVVDGVVESMKIRELAVR